MRRDSTLCTERCCRSAPSHTQGQDGRASRPRHETARRFRGSASSTSVPASTESVNFIQKPISSTDEMLTSFASFRFWAVYTWRALMATCVASYSPRQVSVDPPDATAMLPCFSSPVERMAEVGSRSMALHTFPNAVTSLASWGLTVGYAFVETTKGEFQEAEKRTDHADGPDRPCPRTSTAPLVSTP